MDQPAQWRFVPARDSCAAAWAVLFNHLVGTGEQRWRYGNAKCLGGLDVDYKLEFCWLLYRKIRRFGTFNDLVDINAGTTEIKGIARTIRYECAGRHCLTRINHSRKSVSQGQISYFLSCLIEQAILRHDKALDLIDAHLGEHRPKVVG